MTISVADVDGRIVRLDRRMRFQFGKSDDDSTDEDNAEDLEQGKRLLLAIDYLVDGETVTGLSMGATGAMWFVKGSEVDPEKGDERLLEAVEAACEHARGIEATTPFEFWQELYAEQAGWGSETVLPPLLWGYGVSLVEQTLIDAYCRRFGYSFGEAVRANELGIELGEIHEELAGREPDELLPDEPLRSVALRHTVGQTDPLTADDLDPADRLEDGLPQTLAEYVDQQGVNHLKIKLTADVDFDTARLARIHEVVTEAGAEEFAFTLDANEAYDSAADFRAQWEQLQAEPALDEFLPNLLYVEQPLARRDAFSDETKEVFTEWDAAPPVIIDESDDRLESLPNALECGYAGTSHKNCKGVFKGIANRCLLEHYHRTGAGEYLMSAEDLTTVGPVGLLQDLAVAGTLGLDHVERNGHHYFRGLSGVPEVVQEAVLSAHGDLYTRHDDGFAALNIEAGQIEIGSVVDAPFGRGFELAPTTFDGYPGLDV